MKLVYLKKNLTRFDAYEGKKKLYVNLRYDFANSNAPYKYESIIQLNIDEINILSSIK